jgi:hypothetical protein
VRGAIVDGVAKIGTFSSHDSGGWKVIMNKDKTFDNGKFSIRYDKTATVMIFRRIAISDVVRCGCAYCRNFAEVRGDVYPDYFKHMLDAFGIDSTKESEVYHYSKLSDGRHLYGGCFHFVGVVLRVPKGTDNENWCQTVEGFKWTAVNGRSLAYSAFDDTEDVAQLVFEAKVPWVLKEAEPD